MSTKDNSAMIDNSLMIGSAVKLSPKWAGFMAMLDKLCEYTSDYLEGHKWRNRDCLEQIKQKQK